MGAKNTKHAKTKKNQNIMKESLENNEILKKNILSKTPNPCFRKKEIFPHHKCVGIEMYKLKDINNAFYCIYTPAGDDDTIIYKYYYEKGIFEKISTIKFESGYLDEIKIKYFYNPLNKKEYLFFLKEYDDILIVQIKAENKFVFINKKKETRDYISSKYYVRKCPIRSLTEIELFDIIYNQYDNNIYIIISCYSGVLYDSGDILWLSNDIKILKFKDDKLILIKNFNFSIRKNPKDLLYLFDMPNGHDDIMNIIYEDKYSKNIIF